MSGLIFLAQAAAAQALPPPVSAYPGPAWSPYLVGVLIGLLVCASMWWAGKPVGASSAYATAAGLAGKAVAPRKTCSTRYFRDEPPAFDSSLVFILATVLGGFLAAWQGGELTQQWLPDFWVDRFGADSLGLRFVIATAGGVLMSFGARMAGGCTSGHGISGTLQLSVSSWLSLLCFFAGGVLVAHILYPAT